MSKSNKAAHKKTAKKNVDQPTPKRTRRTTSAAVSPQTAIRSTKKNLQAWQRGEAVECAANE